MRYVGQGHEIRVPLPAGLLHAGQVPTLIAEFQRVYRELYERLGPQVEIEVLNWRVVSSGPSQEVRLHMPATIKRPASAAVKGERNAYFPEAGGYTSTPVYDRYLLTREAAFAGPAIVEERESTVVIGPGAECHVDAHHNLCVSFRFPH
jgi:N-methylhydantoinase A